MVLSGFLSILFEFGQHRNGVNMGTLIVGGIIAAVVALIIRGMIRDVKQGKSIQCGGDCKHCGGHCGSDYNQ